jgi:Zn-dependent alcohol dehydrogenase
MSVLHKSTQRDYLARVNDPDFPKAKAAELAKLFDYVYRDVNEQGYYVNFPQRGIPRYLRLLQQGRLQLYRLVSTRYPFERINYAITATRKGATYDSVMVEL